MMIITAQFNTPLDHICYSIIKRSSSNITIIVRACVCEREKRKTHRQTNKRDRQTNRKIQTGRQTDR